jgi:STE24 endopeptidase
MNESKATRYQRLRRRARTVSMAAALLTLALIALTPASRILAGAARAAGAGLSGWGGSAVALVVFAGCVVLLCELAGFAASMYLARRAAAASGRTAPRGGELLMERLHAAAVVLPAAIAGGAVIQISAVLAGNAWWLVAGPAIALLLAGAMRFAPVLFASLGEVKPLGRATLAARLSELAGRARVPVAAIDEWVVDESAPATALVTGVGRTRRILVSSEIVRRWSEDEIAVMVAHELAHHAHHDLWRTLALHASVLWAALGAAHAVAVRVADRIGIGGPAELAALPLVALVTGLVWVLATPLANAQSRRQERRADTFALQMTDGVEAFGSAVVRLGAKHLAEERPTLLTRWLYHRHPSVAERLALARAFRKVSAPRPIWDRQ